MKQNDQEYHHFLERIHALFEADYTNARRQIKGAGKAELYAYAPDIYRKWYYSALVEDTVLSPANLTEWLNRAYGYPPMTYDNLCPALTNAGRRIHYHYARHTYTLQNHPITGDLKAMADMGCPLLTLGEDGRLTGEARQALLPMLSIKDHDYGDYLLSISLEIGLMERAPAIHMKALRTATKAAAFFKLNPRQQLNRIFEGAVSLLLSCLHAMLPGEVYTRDTVIGLIKNPLATDDIFERLYSMQGMDLGQLWGEAGDTDADHISDEVQDYISMSIYYLGVGLDRYFFTPMGHYLRFIRPLYVAPVPVAEDVAILYNALREVNSRDSAAEQLYTPCTHYTLTTLGAAFFNLSGGEFPKELLIESSADGEEMLSAIWRKREAQSQLDRLSGAPGKGDAITVYRLKIMLQGRNAFWITVEVDEQTTLSDLHLQICYALDLPIISDYSFYIGSEDSPFKQFTPAQNKRRTRKTEDTRLSSLKLSVGDSLRYVIKDTDSIFEPFFPQKSAVFSVSLTHIRTGEYALLYPRVYQKGKLLISYVNET